jgi:DNA-binding transcriptional LysR family regulator
MKNFDHLQLDGRLLQLLLTVMEERSVTRAAERLDMTQSAVSHALDKLRLIVDDPLFVKSGRGISPTVRAEALAQHARSLLDEMRRFVSAASFDPARLSRTITIAANDLQRDLLLPRLLNLLQAEAPGVSLRVLPSGIPTVEMLRSEECDLVITPRPPDGSDIVQKRLFADQYRVFYDARCRAAPVGLDDYLAAEHVTVGYTRRACWILMIFWPGRGEATHCRLAARFCRYCALCAGFVPAGHLARFAGQQSVGGAGQLCAAALARRCRCIWYGTSAIGTTRCTSGCASGWIR